MPQKPPTFYTNESSQTFTLFHQSTGSMSRLSHTNNQFCPFSPLLQRRLSIGIC